MSLAILRGLILVKRHMGPVTRAILSPLALPGRFLVRALGIPLYRLAFFLKRSTSRFILPAKHRILYLVSNRYAIHVAVIGIAAMVSSLNLNERVVHAESYSSQSMLFALVSDAEANTVEDVIAAEMDGVEEFNQPTSPFREGMIDANTHFDLDFEGESFVTTTVGGNAIASPTISEGSASSAARTSVESYVIAEGDTLGSIADQYGLSLSTLLWSNNLTFRSTIRPGQTLTIPPVDGVIYTVKKGDTLSKIAKTYGSEAEKILAFNKLASADDLVIGEQLIVPDGEPPTPVVRRIAPLSSLFNGSTGSSSSAGSSADTSGLRWVWPTEGHRITLYYGKPEPWGAPHRGLDIDGDYTTHSFAAADGVVIYSGVRRGYGNVIEIDHGSGFVTRYGHHSKLLVKSGDVVKAGDIIGNTGSTGWSTGTHLHIEVIKNGKFQNPLNYIR